MKILMLNYEFPPLGGGAGNSTYYLLREFSRFPSISIDLITSSVDKDKKEKFSDNIIIHYLDIGKNGKNKLKQNNSELLIYALKSYFLGKKLISSTQFDLVHAFFGVPCGYVAKKFNLPYIVSLRGSDVPGHNPKFQTVYKILNPFIRQVWRDSSAVVANSYSLKSEAESFDSTIDFSVIPNGVDSVKFFPSGIREKDNVFRILYIGRFDVVKGINYLLEGFKFFSADKKNVELILIGDGSLYSNIIKQTREDNKIKVLKGCPQNELLNIYHSSDVFVLPSLKEGMSNVVLEAMASGLAVLSTDTGDVSNWLMKDCLLKTGNSFSIADKLDLLYNNRTFLEEIKKVNRLEAEKMNWQEVADKYVSLYKNILLC